MLLSSTRLAHIGPLGRNPRFAGSLWSRTCPGHLQLLGIRTSSTSEAGENNTGHIKGGPDKAILYFDNVYPLRLTWLAGLSWQFGAEKSLPELMDRVQSPTISRVNPVKIFKNSQTPGEVSKLLPRVKEGGAFLKVGLPENLSAQEIEASVGEYLTKENIKPWWNPLQRITVRLVRGRPWLEDLYRLPSSRLKVEFLPTVPGAEVAELTQEQLYSFFRTYGKLSDIMSQPSDSKILPKFAYLDFMGVRPATLAKNCMHGYVVSEAEGGGKAGTVLRLTYEEKVKSSWIKDWLFNHPRIVIPALAALAAAITVSVFDPIRTFFIELHIKRFFNITDNKYFRWFKAQATDILTFRKRREDNANMGAIWDDRKEYIDQIKTWLVDSADTFIVIQGPRGSGKRELVIDQALKDHKYKLIIDCKPIQEARGESATITAAAAQVGYRPVFSWMNSISGMIDLAAQSATGIKAGFSETLDSQLAKILNSSATALKKIALERRKKDGQDANMTDDEYLDAHPEIRPVVVVDNFLHKSQEREIVYDKIAEWAAGLATANIAHVIFLTHDLSFSKSLGKALPDRIFRQISLSDCSSAAAKRYVLSHLESESEGDKKSSEKESSDGENLPAPTAQVDSASLDQCIAAVGGRLTDLEFLARRIKMGETPHKAMDEIIQQASSEILKMYLFNTDKSASGERRWTPEQAWLLIEKLAKSDAASLRYNELVLDSTLKTGGGAGRGPDGVLQALEQAELVSIVVTPDGRPQRVKPGRPVFHAAFKHLVEDRVLRSRMELAILGELVKSETAGIEKCEAELKALMEMPAQYFELRPRMKYLLAKIAGSQEKVEKWEKESDELKGVLTSEF